jgi:nucleotide-binding universal stress UspA family protein
MEEVNMVPARMQIERILCPVDYSDFSERALAQAVRLARWFEASVTAAHVVPPAPWAASPDTGPYVTLPADLLRARREDEAQALERFVGPYRGQGAAVHTRLLDGDASRAIQATAEDLPADLVVMGTHGRGGFEHLLLGSVTEKVLRRATCPVLTVGHARVAPTGGPLFRRILCALDLTDSSSRTLDMALSLAEENMAQVALLHVLEGVPGSSGPPRYRALPEVVRIRRELFKEAEDRLRRIVPDVAREFCTVSERVEEGVAWRELLKVAEAREVDLIVMGAHSRGALAHLFFGSTVSQVVRQAHCPVLVVREIVAGPRRQLKETSTAALSSQGNSL